MKLSECENSGNMRPNCYTKQSYSAEVRNRCIIENNKCMTFGAKFLLFSPNASQCAVPFPEWIADSIDVPLDVQKREKMNKFHSMNDHEFETRRQKHSMESVAKKIHRLQVERYVHSKISEMFRRMTCLVSKHHRTVTMCLCLWFFDMCVVNGKSLRNSNPEKTRNHHQWSQHHIIVRYYATCPQKLVP